MKHFATRGRLLLAVAIFLAAAAPWHACGAEVNGATAAPGIELLDQGRYAEAVAALAEALEADPSSEPLRVALARAWAGLAAGHLLAGRQAESRNALEKAVALWPEETEYHLLLARLLFQANDLPGARREVEEALRRTPQNVPARELSGDLYDREGLLNLAVGEWETAAAAGRSNGLAAKIDRGRREMNAEEGMRRESSRYFVVLYDPAVPATLVQEFFALLDRAFDFLHDKLGEYPRDDITVILYSRAEFRDVTKAPVWAGGLYDGKVRIPVGQLRTVQEAAGLWNTLVHEMTHAFLYRMAPEGLPLWLNEGLANAFLWDPARIRSWFAAEPPEGIATLDDVDRWLRGRGGDVTKAYAAARLAVAEMEELRGFGAVRRVIGGVGEGRRFPEVFRDEMRLDVAEFEERWARGLR